MSVYVCFYFTQIFLYMDSCCDFNYLQLSGSAANFSSLLVMINDNSRVVEMHFDSSYVFICCCWCTIAIFKYSKKETKKRISLIIVEYHREHFRVSHRWEFFILNSLSGSLNKAGYCCTRDCSNMCIHVYFARFGILRLDRSWIWEFFVEFLWF